MGIAVTVRMGGASAATTVDFTPQVPIWTPDGDPVITASQGFVNGEQFQFIAIDDAGEIPKADLTKNFQAHSVVHVTEDGPGFACWLARGRIARKDWGRGDHPWGNSRTAQVTVDDQTSELKGLVLTSNWSRSAESGRARVLAALAAFCNGSPRVTTVISTHLVAAGNEVTMPAKVYTAGTDLSTIFQDCAEVEGKDFSVVIDHAAGVSHLCAWYALPTDHTNYLCAASISDVLGELDTDSTTAPVLPPIWDGAGASLEDGQERPVSHVVLKYGSGDDSFVVASDTTRVTNYDYWATVRNDSDSVSATQATARANGLLSTARTEHVTHQVTVRIKSDQVHLFCAGMSINIKSAASMGGQYLGTVQTRRIASVKFEPIAPQWGGVDGVYDAHLELDRPLRRAIAGQGGPVGPKPPSAGGAPLLQTGGGEVWDDDSIREVGSPFTVGSGSDGAIFAAVLIHPATVPIVYWYPDGHLTPGTRQTLTLIDTVTHASAMKLSLYRLLNPTAGTGDIQVEGDARVTGCAYWYLTGVDQANPQSDYDEVTGTSLSSSITSTPGANSIVLNAAGWGNNDINPSTNPTPGGGQTADIAGFFNDLAGQHDAQFGAGHGSSTPTWTWDGSRNWCAIAVAVSGTGGSGDPEPVGDTADPGDTDSGVFAPYKHAHAHGNITTGGPYHMAEDVTFAPTGTVAATNVQAAIAEVASEATGIPATILDAKGDIIAATAADTAARLAVGTDGHVLTADSTQTTGIKWAAAGSGSDVLVKVSSNDTTAGYLNGKLVAGTNITLTENLDGGNETLTIASSGGSGGGWTAAINESGASFANFTSNSGTWASDGTIIQQTNTGAAQQRATFNTRQILGSPFVMQADIRVPSAGQTSAANATAGFVIGNTQTPGAQGLGVGIRHDAGATNGRIAIENHAVALLRNITHPLVYDTWYTVRVVFNGFRYTVYVGGTEIGSGSSANTAVVTFEYVHLWCFTRIADFRNIKSWYVTLP